MSSQTDLVGFAPGLRLRLEARDYVIKTAESPEEVRQALRLRYDVFYGEVLRRTNPQQLDLDRFDSICDHMLVVEPGTGRVVGTYRLNSSRDDDYYARQEFDLDAILRLKGNKLEIGRGCVAKQCRNRGVFMMLWKGIAEYMRRAGTRYLFGCSSMPASEDIERVAALYGYLLRKHYSSRGTPCLSVEAVARAPTSGAQSAGRFGAGRSAESPSAPPAVDLSARGSRCLWRAGLRRGLPDV